MKDAEGDLQSSSSTSRSGNGSVRSAAEKERTRLRERQRRSITTKIFQGLRKHGGYHLSPRADINEVLRHLAQEAGWVIEHDGTTYRPASSITDSSGVAVCPLCGSASRRATPTPTNSLIGTIGTTTDGDCSTTTSPRHTAATRATIFSNFSNGFTSAYPSSISPSPSSHRITNSSAEIYMQAGCVGGGGPHQMFLQETGASV